MNRFGERSKVHGMVTQEEQAARTGFGWMQVAGLASIGAGVIHAAAVGVHSEHATLSRLFVTVAVAQIGIGLLALVKGGRLAAAATAVVNSGAVAAWAVTRIWDISWIAGLEESEAPQFTDTTCAALGALAAGTALLALSRGRTAVGRIRLGVPAGAIGSLTIVAMLLGANHVHSGDGHSEGEEAAAHTHGDDAAATHDHADEAATEGTAHVHGDEAATEGTAHAHSDEPAADGGAADGEAAAAHDHGDDAAAAAAWPRPWDPTAPIDFSGVPGVTRKQQRRAEALVQRTLDVLPKFADVSTLPALGFKSIGDERTGYEHFINYGYIFDDAFLDPNAPESLVFRVDGEQRTLVSAMYIGTQMPIDSPQLTNYGGPLMQWHVHENLCWAGSDDGPKVVGVVDAEGNCPPGSVNAGGENPMVHVWIAPHECGPFAALEGHGAGQADAAPGERTDQCAAHEHGDDATSASLAYDPTQPIDLSGLEGVTPEQQAFAENTVAENVLRLPQWSDPTVAEAAGYRSIGDAATGHEHYINWDSIDDDVWLDPDHPESLVYEPQPDGSKKLVSAMYMLPTTMPLEEVPDWGGALMQWHIHNNLCFTADPEAPTVAGLTDADGNCAPPLQELAHAPMIHVWITPHPCGPFAALEGVGAGQVLPGEEHFCDQVHGEGH